MVYPISNLGFQITLNKSQKAEVMITNYLVILT